MRKKNIIVLLLIFVFSVCLSNSVNAQDLSSRLSGKILLQIQEHGEAWYVYPDDLKRYYLGRPQDAFDIMRNLGLGISNADLSKIPTKDDSFAGDTKLRNRLKGQILLQVESHGQAWYIFPDDLKRYYLGRPADAFRIMRELGLGITNTDLGNISIAPEEEDEEIPKEEEEKPALTVTQLTFLEDLAADPSWSPDGSQIVFLGLEKDLMKGGLYIMNNDGTEIIKIAGQWGREHLFNPSWNPIDNRIVGHGMENNGLFLVDLDGDQTKRIQLTTQKSEMPSWSPDGKKIAYNVYNEEKSFSSIWVMNADGSGKTQLTTDEDGFCTGPSFSYDGLKIVYLKGFTSYAPESKNRPPNEIWIMNSDGSNKHMIYAPEDSSQVIRERAWNKNDKILFARHKLAQGFPQIWIINSDGINPQSILEPPDGAPITIYDDPVWDNSGTKVAVTKVIGASGDIWQVATFSWEE